jgi:cytochrome b561
MILLVALHAGAALLHFLVLRDGVMARMLPRAGRWP